MTPCFPFIVAGHGERVFLSGWVWVIYVYTTYDLLIEIVIGVSIPGKQNIGYHHLYFLEILLEYSHPWNSKWQVKPWMLDHVNIHRKKVVILLRFLGSLL